MELPYCSAKIKALAISGFEMEAAVYYRSHTAIFFPENGVERNGREYN